MFSQRNDDGNRERVDQEVCGARKYKSKRLMRPIRRSSRKPIKYLTAETGGHQSGRDIEQHSIRPELFSTVRETLGKNRSTRYNQYFDKAQSGHGGKDKWKVH